MLIIMQLNIDMNVDMIITIIANYRFRLKLIIYQTQLFNMDMNIIMIIILLYNNNINYGNT